MMSSPASGGGEQEIPAAGKTLRRQEMYAIQLSARLKEQDHKSFNIGCSVTLPQVEGA
jgi:hypothetical protein